MSIKNNINNISINTILSHGIAAHNFKEQIATQNLVNEETVGADGSYRRELVIFNEKDGVINFKKVQDSSALKNIYNPTHPYANEQGFVAMPNVDRKIEILDRNDARLMKNILFKIFADIKRTSKKVYETMMGA